jgi:hypothetical protein
MIEIIIDYNNDRVTCLKNGKKDWEFTKPGHMKMIGGLIYEILNSTQTAEIGNPDIRLSEIDEDKQTTIDEW